MFAIFLLTVGVQFLGLGLYMLYRSNWVCDKQLWWNNQSYQCALWGIANDCASDCDLFRAAIIRQSPMLSHYALTWDMDKMVVDKKLYDYVNSHQMTEVEFKEWWETKYHSRKGEKE